MTLSSFGFNDITSDFEGAITNNEHKFSLSICDFDKEQQKDAKILAVAICSWLEIHLPELKNYAAARLLHLKNSSWLEEGEAEITEAEFIGKILLDGIIAFSEGSFEVYFKDNDLFWGHLIKVDIESNFKMSDANIVG